MSIPTRAELDALIAQRLDQDPAFRDALIEDPRAAISSLVGMDVPDFVTITVHPETLTDVHLVLPADTSTGHVSEKDLELVAGGTCWDNLIACTAP